jgi:hypothetical protein
VPVRVCLVYDGDDVADALLRSAHFAVHVYSEGGISVLAMREDGYVQDAVLDGGGGGAQLSIYGHTGSHTQPSAAAAVAELDWRNSVMQRILERSDAPAPPIPAPGNLSPPPPASPGGSRRLAVRDLKSKPPPPQQQQPCAPCSPTRRHAFKTLHRQLPQPFSLKSDGRVAGHV